MRHLIQGSASSSEFDGMVQDVSSGINETWRMAHVAVQPKPLAPWCAASVRTLPSAYHHLGLQLCATTPRRVPHQSIHTG